MRLAAASGLAKMRFGDGDALEPGTQQMPSKAPAGNGAAQNKVRGGLFGRLTPVNEQMHSKLTKGGYKHDANYETQSGSGRFGYYSNPASGHKVIVDEQGNVQDQIPPKPNKGAGGGGQQRMQFNKDNKN
jgi:hypothetical protein